MRWNRRRDLEGGKELGIWLAIEDENVVNELYVESHEYRGGNYDVYTATPDGEWTHYGEFDDVDKAFEKADEIREETS